MDRNHHKKKLNLRRFGDLSLWYLIFSNIATIYFAIIENWNISTIMWIYWFQNIIIGLFNIGRIYQLNNVIAEKISTNGETKLQTQNETKFTAAFSFLFIYGFFHIAYIIVFLSDSFSFKEVFINSLNPYEFKYIILSVLFFFISHYTSLLHNKPSETKEHDVVLFIFFPFFRIIPIHVIVILGAHFEGVLILFLILKSFADLIMHIVENKILSENE